MSALNKIVLGVLLLLVSTSVIYVWLGSSAEFKIEKTKTTLLVNVSGQMVVGGVEWVELFNGSTKLKKNLSSVNVSFSTLGDLLFVTRTTRYDKGQVLFENYSFSTTNPDINLFPLSHQITILNAVGLVLQYKVTGLKGNGSTRNVNSPQVFGNNIKVEWQDGAYYQKLTKLLTSYKLTVKYKVTKNNQTFLARLSDPSVKIPDWFKLTNRITVDKNKYDFTSDNKAVKLEKTLMNLTVTPAVAQGWNGNGYLQHITLCNKEAVDKYYFSIYNFSDITGESLKVEVLKNITRSVHILDDNNCQKQLINISEYDNISKNITKEISVDVCNTYLYNHTDTEVAWDNVALSSTNIGNFSLKNSEGLKIAPKSCKNLKLAYSSGSKTGKWDLIIYADSTNDAGCVARNDCDEHYLLDPWYDTTSLTNKRFRELRTNMSAVTKPVPVLINGSFNWACRQDTCWDYIPTNGTTYDLLPFETDTNVSGNVWLWALQDLVNQTITYDLLNDSTIANFGNETGVWQDYEFVWHGNNPYSTGRLGNLHNGTLVGTNSHLKNNTPLGRAYNFTSTDTYINFSNDFAYKPNGSKGGFVLFMATSTATPGTVVGNGDCQNVRNGYCFAGDGANYKCYVGGAAGYTAGTGIPGATLRAGWHQVACIWDINNLYTYLDGTLFSTTAKGDASYPTQSSAYNLQINNGQTGAGTPAYYDKAVIDELRIFNYTMTTAEVSAIWEMGKNIYNVFNASESFSSVSVLYNFTNISVNKRALASLVNVSQNLTYQINISNTGNGTAFNVTINDTLPLQVIWLASSPTAVTGTNNTWYLNLTRGQNVSINVTVLVMNITNNSVINNSVNVSWANETGENVRYNTSTNISTTVLVPVAYYALIIAQNEPATNTKFYSTQPIGFNFTITGNSLFYNATLQIGGVTNTTISNIANNTKTEGNVSFYTSQTGRTWSINASTNTGYNYSANRTFDVFLPYTFITTQNKPDNATIIYVGESVGFNTTITGQSTRYNVTLQIDGLTNTTLSNVANNTLTEFNTTFYTAGNHNWSINSSASYSSNYSLNRTFNVTFRPYALTVTQNAPASGVSLFVGSKTGLNGTITGESSFYNATLQLNGITNTTISNIANNTKIEFNVTLVTGGAYTWSINASASYSYNYSANRTFGTVLFNFTNASISKTDNVDPANASQNLLYQINISNTGNTSAFNVTINDTYPAETIYVSVVPVPTASNNTWSLGTLPVGYNLSINVTVLVRNISNGAIINNSVNITYQNETSGLYSRTATQATTINNPPLMNFSNVSITKIDTPDPVNTSQNLTYQINISVTGNTTSFNITVNDTYPNEVIYLASSPAPLAGTNNTWILGNLTNGTKISINVTLLVLNITNGTVLNNSANVTFKNETSGLYSRKAIANTTVFAPTFNISTVKVTKTDSPDPVNASTNLIYQINVSGNGTGIAYNVTVNDTYPSQVIYLTSVPSPISGTNNSWNLGSLAPGTNISINITMLVRNISNNTQINNSVNVTFNNETSALLSRLAVANTTVNNPPLMNFTNISVTKTDNPDGVNASWNLSYQINVSNTGNGTAYNVTINDTYPLEIIYLTALPTPVTGTNNTWYFNLSWGTNLSINITVLVKNITNGAIINNTVNVSWHNESGENVRYNASRIINTTTNNPPLMNYSNISVSKTGVPNPVNVSTNLTYQINVSVTGNTTSFNITVNDTYPLQIIYLTSSPTPLSGTNNTWILGNLSFGTNISINITVLVKNITHNVSINNTVKVTYQNETSGTFNKTTNLTVIVNTRLDAILCPNMTKILLWGNASYYNTTTGTLTQYNISPQNQSVCGWSYNLTPHFTGTIQARINVTYNSSYALRYNNAAMNSSWKDLVLSVVAETSYLINISADYLNASASAPSWEDYFQVT